MKLLLDEHYTNEIAVQLRESGYEAFTVSERRLNGTDDETLLALAASENSALLTNNARDFLPMVARWATSGQDHCGLLLTSDISMPRSKDNIGTYVRTLSELMQAHPGARALENQVRWLP